MQTAPRDDPSTEEHPTKPSESNSNVQRGATWDHQVALWKS
jgi:hypothetical protein